MHKRGKLSECNFGRSIRVSKAKTVTGLRQCCIHVTWGYCPIDSFTVPQFIEQFRKVLKTIKPESIDFSKITESRINQGFTLAKCTLDLTPKQIHKFKAAGFYVTRSNFEYYWA